MTQPPEAGDLREAVERVQRIIDAELLPADPETDTSAWIADSVPISDLRLILSALPSDLEPSDLRSSPAPSQGDVELRAALEPFAAWGGYVDDHVYGDLPDDAVMYSSIRPADGHRITITALDLRRAARAITAMPVSAGYPRGVVELESIVIRKNEVTASFDTPASAGKFFAFMQEWIAKSADDDGKEGR